MDNYIFPCVLIYQTDGVAVYFPDLDGCVSFGENEQQAFLNAKEALALHLYGMEQDGDIIPVASTVKSIELDENEQVVLVDTYMPTFRAKQASKFIKKTLTIPEWLNVAAEREGINFSQVLQGALKEKLMY